MQLKRIMHEDLEQLDAELAQLGSTLRAGNLMGACLQLAEFALKLDRYIRREERTLSLAYAALEHALPAALETVHKEHQRLRLMISAIASALDRADDGRGAEIVGKLRSVLLLHVLKEEQLLAAPTSRAVH